MQSILAQSNVEKNLHRPIFDLTKKKKKKKKKKIFFEFFFMNVKNIAVTKLFNLFIHECQKHYWNEILIFFFIPVWF